MLRDCCPPLLLPLLSGLLRLRLLLWSGWLATACLVSRAAVAKQLALLLLRRCGAQFYNEPARAPGAAHLAGCICDCSFFAEMQKFLCVFT